MADPGSEYTLEFLLAFDGRVHHLEGGYSLRFEIIRVQPTPDRPHGISYSLTLHTPDSARLVGFDNAHPVRPPGSRFSPRAPADDHWHRSETDPGRPYRFTNVETLLDDFQREVERALRQRGVEPTVVAVVDRRRSE